jgi:HK97 family phage prohead protease
MRNVRGFFPPPAGEGGRVATGWGRLGEKSAFVVKSSPPVGLADTLPLKGRENGGVLVIQGYASLWGVADLNGDVVARGAFAESLARTGVGGVRMLHQHEARAVVGVWDRMVEDERGLWVEGRVHDWSPEARYAAALARAGAMDGLSIGFKAGRARRDGRLRVLVEVALWEVSLVTFPMLPGARFVRATK